MRNDHVLSRGTRLPRPPWRDIDADGNVDIIASGGGEGLVGSGTISAPAATRLAASRGEAIAGSPSAPPGLRLRGESDRTVRHQRGASAARCRGGGWAAHGAPSRRQSSEAFRQNHGPQFIARRRTRTAGRRFARPRLIRPLADIGCRAPHNFLKRVVGFPFRRSTCVWLLVDLPAIHGVVSKGHGRRRVRIATAAVFARHARHRRDEAPAARHAERPSRVYRGDLAPRPDTRSSFTRASWSTETSRIVLSVARRSPARDGVGGRAARARHAASASSASPPRSCPNCSSRTRISSSSANRKPPSMRLAAGEGLSGA